MAIHTPIEAERRGIPAWALLLTGLVLAAGVAFYAFNLGGENPPIGGESHPPGGNAMALIEGAGCQNCHGPDLSGGGNFPSLHGVAGGPVSENLQPLGEEHPDNWANLWIAGVDPAVADLDRGGMPVFGGPEGQLTEEQIATIVEYLKTLQ